jgi:Uma2 family endonuclease
MNIASTQAADGLPRREFTVADIRRMLEAGILVEYERFELIQGDIVMLDHNLAAHEVIKMALIVALVRQAPDELLVGAATTLQLTNNTLVDADLAIIRRAGYKPSESGFAQPAPDDILLVIEVGGPNSKYESDVKARLYARYGVREFWLIDPFERIARVHTGPSGDSWSSMVERGPNETLTTAALPTFAIKLAEIN